jgi:hypothetical protein
MKPAPRFVAPMLCAAIFSVTLARAEEPSVATRPAAAASARQWTAREPLQSSPSQSGSGGAHGATVGAIVGGVSAAVVVASLAKTYGENETGGFCGGCFATWGVWAIPAGMLAGAAIGHGIDKAASPQHALPVPRTVIAPVVGRRAGGVVMTVRY